MIKITVQTPDRTTKNRTEQEANKREEPEPNANQNLTLTAIGCNFREGKKGKRRQETTRHDTTRQDNNPSYTSLFFALSTTLHLHFVLVIHCKVRLVNCLPMGEVIFLVNTDWSRCSKQLIG